MTRQKEPHITGGAQKGTIPVRLSYRIIELFSDGLYSSPNKAIEELVANAFDAGAENVHVIVSPDRTQAGAYAVVIDDGEAMDEEGLRRHWNIGRSEKKRLPNPPKGRAQIGQFGIGKLATYVLAKHFTLICKRSRKYRAVTIDYDKLPAGNDGGIDSASPVQLSLREMTAAEAKDAVFQFIGNEAGPGYDNIPLFGAGAKASWTIAILSSLRPKALELRIGRLSWVLRTAMPLRDDFSLFLNGERQMPSKIDQIRRLKKWVLGKDTISTLEKTSAVRTNKDHLELDRLVDRNATSKIHRHGLVHPVLGRITGYLELYAEPITGGKSESVGRSNGFFVYVNGRLINLDDSLFGMKPLRHGTFAKFRMVAHMNGLNNEIRSSREQIREGQHLQLARDILHLAFNEARNWLVEHEDEAHEGRKIQLSRGPRSLTRRPILGFLSRAIRESFSPYYTHIPAGDAHVKDAFIRDLEERAQSDEGLVTEVLYCDLGLQLPMCAYHPDSGVLEINNLHPFIHSYLESEGRDGTLKLIVWSEVLAEAQLESTGLTLTSVRQFMIDRDSVFRSYCSWVRKPALQVAQSLLDAAHDKDQLEQEAVNAFDLMGFAAMRVGGSGKPDGIAVADLGPDKDGVVRRYKVAIETKSNEREGTVTSANAVGVSRLARHRAEFDCDHSVVIAESFPTSRENAALLKEIATDRRNTGKSITLVRLSDFSRLVPVFLARDAGLNRLRGLFENCSSPEESARWIDELEHTEPRQRPFRELLEAIWTLGRESPSEAVEFAAVVVVLRTSHKIRMVKEEVRDLCHVLSVLSSHVVLRSEAGTVELNQRPDVVLAALPQALNALDRGSRTSASFQPKRH